jgi:SAM-dependent methyltransferase
MTSFDAEFWEQHWSRGERTPDEARELPDAHLAAELAGLEPGAALDAGCGNGRNAIWLAKKGWRVTAVDVSPSALAIARRAASEAGAAPAGRITWVQANLQQWAPEHHKYELLTCLYVHVPGSISELVQRLATGVAPGGTLFFVGHSPHDPACGIDERMVEQRHASVDTVRAALDPTEWKFIVAEDRTGGDHGQAVDSIVHATRLR